MRSSPIGFLTVLFLSFPGCARSNIAPVTATTPISGTAAVAGRVYSDPVCGNSAVQVSFVSGSTTLYQTSVPANGTFEFQANPGVYTVVARSGNCGAQQSITVMGNQMAQASLNLTSGGYSQTPMLPGTTGATGYYPQVPQVPTYQPWPATYPSSPCPWSYYGCGGWYYPGWGDVGIGKPILYVHGPAGTDVKIQVKLDKDSNLLAASPAHGRSWRFTVDPAGLIFGADRYTSVYYDLRTHSRLLGEEKVFCVAKDGLLANLENYLTNSGFEDREVKDFHEAWDGKFPLSARYCVYPQDGQVVERVAELVVEPKPISVIRIWFLIVPERDRKMEQASLSTKGGFGRFVKFNRTSAKSVLALTRHNPNRTLASTSPQGLALHEWAVGFLFEPKP
jgi:hypothetical protein